MKRLLFFSVFMLALLATNVALGQSTGTTPAPGATHNYSVATHVGSTYAWTVTKGNLTTAAGTDAVLSAASAATTDIAWASSVTVGAWYYVHLLETDANGCSNEKVLPVHITASPFTLAIAAAKATSCYNGAVTVSLNGNDVQYDHGNTTIVYTVTPSGLSGSYSGYSFDLSLTVPTGYTSTVAFSANGSISGNKVTVTDNNAVTITYTVDNTNVYTNTNDADGTAADYTATAAISAGKAINGVSDNETGVDNGATAVSRPHTTGIQTN
jgi:hypothetical protein